MKIRIILGNLLAVGVLLPIIYVHNHWGDILSSNYTDGYTRYADLSVYLRRIYNGFPLFALAMLIGSLLPFQFIKCRYLYKRKTGFFVTSLSAYVVINMLSVLLTGYGFLLLANFPADSRFPFVLQLVVFSAVVQSFLYLVVDRPITKGMET